MQASLLAPLDDLAARAAAIAPAGSRLVVASAFTPRADDLRATGRALHLRHTALDPGRLAALAHAAGFDFVRRLPVSDLVYAAMAPAAPVVIRPKDPAVPVLGADLREGGTLAFVAEPAPVLGLSYAWSIVPCGRGRLAFAAPATTGRSISVKATAPGMVTLRCEIAFKGRPMRPRAGSASPPPTSRTAPPSATTARAASLPASRRSRTASSIRHCSSPSTIPR